MNNSASNSSNVNLWFKYNSNNMTEIYIKSNKNLNISSLKLHFNKKVSHNLNLQSNMKTILNLSNSKPWRAIENKDELSIFLYSIHNHPIKLTNKSKLIYVIDGQVNLVNVSEISDDCENIIDGSIVSPEITIDSKNRYYIKGKVLGAYLRLSEIIVLNFENEIITKTYTDFYGYFCVSFNNKSSDVILKVHGGIDIASFIDIDYNYQINAYDLIKGQFNYINITPMTTLLSSGITHNLIVNLEQFRPEKISHILNRLVTAFCLSNLKLIYADYIELLNSELTCLNILMACIVNICKSSAIALFGINYDNPRNDTIKELDHFVFTAIYVVIERYPNQKIDLRNLIYEIALEFLTNFNNEGNLECIPKANNTVRPESEPESESESVSISVPILVGDQFNNIELTALSIVGNMAHLIKILNNTQKNNNINSIIEIETVKLISKIMAEDIVKHICIPRIYTDREFNNFVFGKKDVVKSNDFTQPDILCLNGINEGINNFGIDNNDNILLNSDYKYDSYKYVGVHIGRYKITGIKKCHPLGFIITNPEYFKIISGTKYRDPIIPLDSDNHYWPPWKVEPIPSFDARYVHNLSYEPEPESTFEPESNFEPEPEPESPYDNILTQFYTDSVEFEVTGNFGIMSYGSYYTGFMGGKHKLIYSNTCCRIPRDFNPEPEPEPEPDESPIITQEPEPTTEFDDDNEAFVQTDELDQFRFITKPITKVCIGKPYKYVVKTNKPSQIYSNNLPEELSLVNYNNGMAVISGIFFSTNSHNICIQAISNDNFCQAICQTYCLIVSYCTEPPDPINITVSIRNYKSDKIVLKTNNYDSRAISYSITKPPMNGYITKVQDTVFYTPVDKQSGNDHFIYSATYGPLVAKGKVEIINQKNNSYYNSRFYIAGRPRVGNILYLRNSRSESDNVTYYYQWQTLNHNNKWEDILNANKSQYTIDMNDLMKKIRIKLTFKKNNMNNTIFVPDDNSVDSLLVVDTSKYY